MNTVHYEAGALAATQGDWRTAPTNLKIITQPWKDWYAGFDAATEAGSSPKLTAKFGLRKNSPLVEASV